MKQINTFLFEKVSLSLLDALTRESQELTPVLQGFILHFVSSGAVPVSFG